MTKKHSDAPASRPPVIHVGQDRRGRWLVQDSTGQIEGVFVNRESALGFAQAERDLHRSLIEITGSPLVARLLH